jgi:hypothetical protein
LQRHLLTAHTGSPEQLHCNKCGKQVLSAEDLKIHLATAHNTSNLPSLNCPLCPKTFLHETRLEKHLSYHQGSEENRACRKIKKPVPKQSFPSSFRCQHCAEEGKETLCATLYLYQRHLLGRHKCAAVAQSTAAGVNIPRPCVPCSADLTVYAQLAAFIRKRNSVPRNHVCAVCRKAFRTKKVK